MQHIHLVRRDPSRKDLYYSASADRRSAERTGYFCPSTLTESHYLEVENILDELNL